MIFIRFEDTPLAAKIIDVICLDSRAFLLWTSSYTNSSDDIFEEKLQYKRYEDKLFELSDNQNWNRTNNHCQLTQITGLEHNSEYVFRVLTSNKYGSVYSNNRTCVTGAQENQGKICFLYHFLMLLYEPFLILCKVTYEMTLFEYFRFA